MESICGINETSDMKKGQKQCVHDFVLGSMSNKMLDHHVQQLMSEVETCLNHFHGHQEKLLGNFFQKLKILMRLKGYGGC